MSAIDHQFLSCIETGRRAHERGDIGAALTAYRRALELMPDHPHARSLYGLALLHSGDASAALEHLETASRAKRNDAWIAGNLAHAYFSNARYAEACEAFRKASRLEPQQGQFQLGIANSLAMQGKLAEAETVLRRLAARYPDDAIVWFNFGNVMRDRSQPQEALRCYARALELEPRFIDARVNLGRALHSQYRFDEAEREYRSCLEIDANHLPVRLNLASVLLDAGEFVEAEQVCRDVLAQAPNIGLAYTLLGTALDHQGKMIQALEFHRSALALAPEDPAAVQKHAVALAHAGELDAALAEFSRAVEMTPDADAVRVVRANTLLAWGRVAEGWADYASRDVNVRLVKSVSTPAQSSSPGTTLVRSLPESIRGLQLTLLPEQGLGDELFFLRFAVQLHEAGARIAYRTNRRLLSLLARVEAIEHVVDQAEAQAPEGSAVLIGDLPHALGERRAKSWPANGAGHPPHEATFEPAMDRAIFPPPLALTPLASAIDAARARLAAAGKPPYVAVTWGGGTPPRDQRMGNRWALHKTIPVAALAGVLRAVRGTIVVIQRNPAAAEMAAFRAALNRDAPDFSDANDDLEAMLALLSIVDEYIGVSNTNMHLRAGVATSARVLVPRPAEWRWMEAGDASPWFPGFSIYRQSLTGEWDAALAALARDLAQLSSTHASAD